MRSAIINISVLFSILISASCSKSIAQEGGAAVDLTNTNLLVQGANYTDRSENEISFSRFNPEMYVLKTNELGFNADKAKGNSGIRLRFKTSSTSLAFRFELSEGVNRGAEFALFRDGNLVLSKAFNQKQAQSSMDIVYESDKSSTSVYELTLPSLANVKLASFEIDVPSELLPIEENRPIYFAIGNSITHGVGQGSATHLTYPYVLAGKLNVNLYNLAIGGAKVSQPLAEMLEEMPQADVISYFIGYNDLHFNNKSIEQYVQDYGQFLETLRKSQPNADVYCISLTHTRSTGNEKTGITPNDYREALKALVLNLQNGGDKKLHFIAGDKITSEANLRQEVLTDKVHFGITGAALFAEELFNIISTTSVQ